MSTTRPELPSGLLRIDPPPALPAAEGASGAAMNAIPMLGSLGSIVLVATIGAGSSTVRLVGAGMFLLGTVGFVLVQVDRQRRQRDRQLTGARASYLRHLRSVRAAARDAADRQRRALGWLHPEPAALPSVAADRTRVWERTPEDPAFLQVRYGACAQPLALELVPPDAVADVDPAADLALRRLLAVHRVQPGLPAAVDLRAFRRISVSGPATDARDVARALVCAAAVFHRPDHLVVAILAAEERAGDWEWVKWLPHARSTRRQDAVGPARLLATSAAGLAALLPADGAELPHLLVVVDGPDPGEALGAGPGTTVIDVGRGGPPAAGELWLEIPAAERGPQGELPVRAVRHRAEPVAATADRCDVATAEALARRLAPLHSPARPGGATSAATDLPTLLGLDGLAALDPATTWRRRSERDRLRVPIGVDEAGSVVRLDLKESAQEGMGPHGLVVGATGSGKSELLRTLVLGLATTHPPDQLNLVLVDFKGGATFAGLSDLPHVSAVITNLASELALVDRMHDALSGEMVRRQEVLRQAGGLASARDHERAREAGAPLPPLPSLLVVVDEFSELLAAKPELTDLFVAVGRLGRSLGLHLLLASQRLEEGRLRGLESHLSYRIGLRTFSAQESRTVLGVPDAYQLPAVPGLGYLREGPTSLTRFRAAYVSGPPPAAQSVRRRGAAPRPTILPFTAREVRVARPPTVTQPAPDAVGPSLLDLAVRRLAGHGQPAHRVWLPPLDEPDTLDRLIGPDRAAGALRIPVGTVDRPREQRRDPLLLDLGGAGGHVAVVGGPRSGKSTLLRTILAATALTTTPLETQWYVLDFGGGTFAPLTGLPHLAGVGTRAEPDVVRRVVAEVTGILDRREALFRTHGIDSVDTYRRWRREGRTDDGYGDVFLCVDGWSTMRADFDDLEPQVQQLVQRGLAYGVHLVAATARWADFRAALRDQLGTRLELRLGDALDSEVDRRAAAAVPAGRPGRGLLPGPLHFLAALPRIDGDPAATTLADGVEGLVAAVAGAWRGPESPRLRLLPGKVDLEEVRAGTTEASGILLGLDQRDLAPVRLDVDAEPHLLVLGDSRSGKSALLRTYLREVVRTRSTAQAQVVLVDYRRSLLGEVPDRHLLHYLTSAAHARPALEELAGYLQARLPGPEVTAAQLRDRSWWTGAEVFVVVDDYDLVATSQGSPVAALQPLLAQACDVGLHLVVARRTGGAARALFEPVIQTLRDLAAPGVLLSGSPDEGPLLGGVRPSRAAPGRARLVTRDSGAEVVQIGWTEPTA